jgi:hypothetical protein
MKKKQKSSRRYRERNKSRRERRKIESGEAGLQRGRGGENITEKEGIHTHDGGGGGGGVVEGCSGCVLSICIESGGLGFVVSLGLGRSLTKA